jgi:predicted Zn-dependent protease
MPLPTHPIVRAIAWLSASLLVAGCSSADSRAQAALNEYQAASASNDLPAAQKALLKLVRAKDDVSEYWVELGKLDTTLRAYNDAYYAFTRAYELDRSNPDLLRALIQLALRTGDLATAQDRAKELDILAPGDQWVKIANGWAAVGESRYQDGVSIADQLLTQAPLDPIATALKARSLFGLGRDDDAITLLKNHLQSIPTDTASLGLLAQIYERHEDWANVAAIRQRLDQAAPGDPENLTMLVNAALRSGNVPLARSASSRLLRPDSPPSLVSSIMDLWSAEWQSPERVADALKLAAAAPPQQKLVYASFVSRWGDPADAIKLIGGAASLPVKAENAEANAVMGEALLQTGSLPAAKSRLDAVISFDPGNATALRARSQLELRTNNAAAAVEDAQKLITVAPNSASDRLLLSRAFAAAGSASSANRALWTAFRDIPANDAIYAALKNTKAGDADGLADLQSEFDRQRDAQVRKGIL